MIMKKVNFWSVLTLMVLSLPLVVSCGGDDENPSNSNDNNGSYGTVDGVHINNRKLMALDVSMQDNSYTLHYNMSYDSKGRLNKIIMPFTSTSYHDGVVTETKTEDVQILNIDYDLKVVEYFEKIKGVYNSETQTYERQYDMSRCYFTLNNNGFISRFGDCELSYNKEGYLVGANSAKDMWTFAYDNGDIIKYMVESLKSGNIDIYYSYYGEKDGDLYFVVNSQRKWSEYWSEAEVWRITLLIAYHAGLFGNISKHCINLPNSSSKNAILEKICDKDKSSLIFRCSFVFD